nr:YciI family protein [Thalassococcus sp. S3]
MSDNNLSLAGWPKTASGIAYEQGGTDNLSQCMQAPGNGCFVHPHPPCSRGKTASAMDSKGKSQIAPVQILHLCRLGWQKSHLQPAIVQMQFFGTQKRRFKMHFVVLFTDATDADPGLRQRHMEKHLAFLEEHSDRIIAAGPLTETEGTSAGGLWLVNAKDEEEIESLIRSDPFWTTGLRDTHRILRWKQVFANGQRQI